MYQISNSQVFYNSLSAASGLAIGVASGFFEMPVGVLPAAYIGLSNARIETLVESGKLEFDRHRGSLNVATNQMGAIGLYALGYSVGSFLRKS